VFDPKDRLLKGQKIGQSVDQERGGASDGQTIPKTSWAENSSIDKNKRC
jgi:hypothetical protein